jgi:ribosomal-protein-alanine N-acetyltransferase
MILDRPLETPHLTLATLSRDQAAGAYLAWMNDAEIVRYTESRGKTFDAPALESFIAECNDSDKDLLLGMFDKADGAHVGNIKLGPVDFPDSGEIGLILGDRRKWGRGFGREAIAAVTRYAFDELRLAKTTAGCYVSNAGSIRAFLAAGWHEEERRPRVAQVEGKWEDIVRLARKRSDI